MDFSKWQNMHGAGEGLLPTGPGLPRLVLSVVQLQLDGVAPLIANPPPANFTIMHSRLIGQDKSLCLGKPAYFHGRQNRPNFWTNDAILKYFKNFNVFPLFE